MVLAYQFLHFATYWLYGLVVLCLADEAVVSVMIVRKLRSLNVEPRFIRKTVVQRWVSFIGGLAYMALIILLWKTSVGADLKYLNP